MLKLAYLDTTRGNQIMLLGLTLQLAFVLTLGSR